MNNRSIELSFEIIKTGNTVMVEPYSVTDIVGEYNFVSLYEYLFPKDNNGLSEDFEGSCKEDGIYSVRVKLIEDSIDLDYGNGYSYLELDHIIDINLIDRIYPPSQDGIFYVDLLQGQPSTESKLKDFVDG